MRTIIEPADGISGSTGVEVGISSYKLRKAAVRSRIAPAPEFSRSLSLPQRRRGDNGVKAVFHGKRGSIPWVGRTVCGHHGGPTRVFAVNPDGVSQKTEWALRR